MLKYVDTLVSFSEVPDEISLCINISGCPNNCEGCHSSYLREDIGTELTDFNLKELINSNSGITCVCFMGGDQDPDYINQLSVIIKRNYPNLKTAWYSGKESIPEIYCGLGLYLDDFIKENFDYIKLGPYIPEKGPLDNPNTNQRFFRINHENINGISFTSDMEDITYKFWK